MNYVNAPLIAAESGVEVVEERRRASRDFTNLIRVSVRADGDELRVSGTTIGREDRLWLVSALGFELEMELAPLMAMFRYDDVPGVIGRVGTLFGEAGVNIANMAVSRTRKGEKALMALSLDSPAPRELIEALSAAGLDDAFFISLADWRSAPGIEAPRDGADAPQLGDDPIARRGFENTLCSCSSWPGDDEEMRAIGPRLLVVLERRCDPVAAPPGPRTRRRARPRSHRPARRFRRFAR